LWGNRIRRHVVQVVDGRWVRASALALAFLLVPCGAAVAEEETPGKLADSWIFWIKAGQEAAFEAAVKEHVAWRKAEGEASSWNAYQPIVGDDLTYFVFRSDGHHWKDFDTNQEWSLKAEAVQKFNEHVAPYVERMEHYISELDTDHTRWVDSAEYRYFGVWEVKLKGGAYDKMNEALTVIHKVAVDQKWSRSYAVAWTIGGEGGMTVVWPFKSYADMADPDPPFSKVLATELGSEDAAKSVFRQWYSSFKSQHYTIYASRPDLSTPE
jgi:hypothetical protein